MSRREIGFWWRPADRNGPSERIGDFAFTDIQPFIRQLTEPKAYLLINFPNINLDFAVCSECEIEMELMDGFGGGDHFATVTLPEAERITERAIEHWDTASLRPLLSDLPLAWLT
jgi:hypothetical protein